MPINKLRLVPRAREEWRLNAARQQGSGEQLNLFDEALKATLRHGAPAPANPRRGRAPSGKLTRRGLGNEP